MSEQPKTMTMAKAIEQYVDPRFRAGSNSHKTASWILATNGAEFRTDQIVDAVGGTYSGMSQAIYELRRGQAAGNRPAARRHPRWQIRKLRTESIARKSLGVYVLESIGHEPVPFIVDAPAVVTQSQPKAPEEPRPETRAAAHVELGESYMLVGIMLGQSNGDVFYTLRSEEGSLITLKGE